MKKLWIGTLVVTVSMVMAASPTAHAALIGSVHDFSMKVWNSSGSACVVCHGAHKAILAAPDAPLWNHEVTNAVFTMYTSQTLEADVGQPNGVSKLCLSCHDGTLAYDSFGNHPGSDYITGSANLGTDLSQNHPVSFTYDFALASADGGVRVPDNVNGTVGTLPLFGGGKDQLECATCHDAHNRSGNQKLLRESDSGSGLCLICHNM